MQIRMSTENSFNIVVGRVSQAKQQSAQMLGGVFDGPQCKVTFSKGQTAGKECTEPEGGENDAAAVQGDGTGG